MKYFCDVHIQSKKDQEARLFIVIPDDVASKTDTPMLTKEMLLQNSEYQEFCSKNKPKLVLADYTLYSTDHENLFASSKSEEFEALITNNEVHRISRSDLVIDSAKDKIAGKRKSKSPVSTALLIGCMLLVALGALGGGVVLGRNSVPTAAQAQPEQMKAANEDGMVIPEQQEIAANAEQITISIDRSYSAVPTEDLQLKGAVVNGVATITLPEFDREDYFAHIPGYSFGFSTKPDGDRIEFYGGKTYNFKSDMKLYRVLVKYGGGSGTKEDPYLIDYYDQLELMSKEKARGYFKQTEDIYFPDYADHKPINTINRLKSDPDEECFEYDGNGYKIENMTAPLFGKVSGAVIKNVNVTNSSISTKEYGDFGMIVCNAYNYRYQTEDGTSFETGETLITNCTVSHCSLNVEIPEEEQPTTDYLTEVVTQPDPVAELPDGIVQYDENGNAITPVQDTTEPQIVEPTKHGEFAVGGITGLGGQIENCYVCDFSFNSALNEYILYAGGISGKPANVINSVVYDYYAHGNIFNVGGIAGSCGAKYYDAKNNSIATGYGGNVQGCAVIGSYMIAEVAVGGIVGEGGTNSEHPIISNCYSKKVDLYAGVYRNDEKIKDGSVGGILGTDGNEKNGHLIMNCVSPSGYDVIGIHSVSRYDDSVRLAPDYAFYQDSIKTVINKNAFHPDAPKEIFTGSFQFNGNYFGDDNGALAYPVEIEELFEKTWEEN